MKSKLFLALLFTSTSFAASEGCPRHQNLHEVKENFNLSIIATKDHSTLDIGSDVKQINGLPKYYFAPDFGSVTVKKGEEVKAIVVSQEYDGSDIGYESKSAEGVLLINNQLMRFDFSRNSKNASDITLLEFEEAMEGKFRLVCTRKESQEKVIETSSDHSPSTSTK